MIYFFKGSQRELNIACFAIERTIKIYSEINTLDAKRIVQTLEQVKSELKNEEYVNGHSHMNQKLREEALWHCQNFNCADAENNCAKCVFGFHIPEHWTKKKEQDFVQWKEIQDECSRFPIKQVEIKQ